MAERRSLHGRLATLTIDPEERARHLALAADGPDAEVAAALEGAARHARARGAPDAAAELAELACEMTAPSDLSELRRRRLVAAEYLFDGGDAGRGAPPPPGDDRRVAGGSGAGRDAVPARLDELDEPDCRRPGARARQALAEAGDDPDLRSGINDALTWVAFYLGDLSEALDRARESADWASRAVEPSVRADALATLAFIEFLRGETNDALTSDAIDLQNEAMTERSWTEGSVYTTPRSILGLQLMWSLRLDDARAIFEHELAEYERHAMYTVKQEVLCYLAELECRAGNWPRAAQLSAEAMNIVEESGQTRTQSHVVLFNQAWPAALLGQVDGRAADGDGRRPRLPRPTTIGSTPRGTTPSSGSSTSRWAITSAPSRSLEPAVAYLTDLSTPPSQR